MKRDTWGNAYGVLLSEQYRYHRDKSRRYLQDSPTAKERAGYGEPFGFAIHQKRKRIANPDNRRVEDCRFPVAGRKSNNRK